MSRTVEPQTYIVADARTIEPHWITRYGFYAFVFSLPFESADIGGVATISRLMGFLFVMTTPFSAGVCYRQPPKGYWFFAAYVSLLFVWTGLNLLQLYPSDGLQAERFQRLFTFTQLMVMFWLSCNMFRHKRIADGSLWALAISCLFLAVFQTLGLTATEAKQARETAFDENPNLIAAVLSVGSLALMGVSYGKTASGIKSRMLFWLGSGALLIGIVKTGSRGALVALVMGFMPFLLQGRSMATKIKLGVIAVIGLAAVAVASFQIEAVRVRWEKTIEEGDLAGRGPIFENAWDLFLEKPIAGWGLLTNTAELGRSLGVQNKDTHNLYLYVMSETGLLGTLPFLIGLWLCWRSAWKGRRNVMGFVPVSLLIFFLVINLKGTYHNRKLFWLVLAYTLASETYLNLRKPMIAAVRRISPRSMTLRPAKSIVQR